MNALSLDFALHADPVELARRARLEPDGWQQDFLRSTHPRILANCSRQSGKSMMAAILGLHTCLFVPDSLVILLSRSQRQSGELFRKLMRAYRDSGYLVPATATTALTLTLRNGARVVALPGEDDAAIRGFSSVDLLVIDEGSRVSDDVYHSTSPMLAVSAGRLVALSTPCGCRGWWYEAWTKGGDDWQRFAITADQCPRIPVDFLARERRAKGEFWVQQEYYGVFVASENQAFSYADIDAAFRADLEPWVPDTGHEHVGANWGSQQQAPRISADPLWSPPQWEPDEPDRPEPEEDAWVGPSWGGLASIWTR